MSLESYIYSVKSGADQDVLVFTFHGTGGDENQFSSLARDLFPRATVISPRGDVSEYGAARFFKRTGEGVYDMTDLAMRTRKMAEFVRSHKDRIAPTRVVGLGYSNGANILASVMFSHADLFDDAVLLHPLIPFTPAPNPELSSKRVLMTAGKADPICPAPLTERLNTYFLEQGAEMSMVWHHGGHEIRLSEIDAIGAFLTI